MVLTFENYTQGNIFACVAKNYKLLNILLNDGLNVIYVNNSILTLFPGNISLTIRKTECHKLNLLNEYDVLEINKNGNAYCCYTSSNSDNAILITDRCNSNCIMCPISEKVRNNGNSKDISQLIEQARYIPSIADHITITGGEPFLIGSNLFNLLFFLKCHLPDTSFLLLTNGRAFSINNYVDQFIKVMPPYMITGIPLHGYNIQTHDAITQSSGSFVQTYWGLKKLLRTNAKVELRIVISLLNANIILKIARLIINEFNKVWRVMFIGLEMLGNAALYSSVVWLPYSEAFEHIKGAIDILISEGIDVGIYNFPLCTVHQGYRSLCHKSISGYKIRYTEKCEDCYEKEACGGIFAGTLRMVNDIKPIER